MEQKNNLTCFNCGRTSSGVYCPDCGQLLQTSKRITMKSFWKEVVMSFASLTPGFWRTFVGLLLHPWQVIRQYINGQRVKYSPPVTMVMQLLLYSTFIYTILGNIFHVGLFCIFFGRNHIYRELGCKHVSILRCDIQNIYCLCACFQLLHCIRTVHRAQIQSCRIFDCRNLYGVFFFHL